MFARCNVRPDQVCGPDRRTVPKHRGGASAAASTASKIRYATSASIGRKQTAMRSRGSLDQRIPPRVQMPAAQVRPDVANLSAPRALRLLYGVKVFLDHLAGSHGFEDLAEVHRIFQSGQGEAQDEAGRANCNPAMQDGEPRVYRHSSDRLSPGVRPASNNRKGRSNGVCDAVQTVRNAACIFGKRSHPTNGSRTAISIVTARLTLPSTSSMALQDLSVSISVSPPILATIQKPLSFIHDPTSEPPPIAVAR